MLDYKKGLLEVSKGNINRTVLNDGPIKAAAFMTQLLTSAEHSVKIYSEKLNKKVTNDPDFLVALERILSSQSISVQIILNKLTNNPEVRKLLLNYSTHNNSLYTLNNTDCIVENLNGDKHFTVVDSLAFRIESNTLEFKAFGNFGNVELGKNLSIFFEHLIENCATPIEAL